MENLFEKDYALEIGEQSVTAIQQKIDIYQDGTTPLYRDVDGKLWAISGHSHCGHVGMFCGTSLDDLNTYILSVKIFAWGMQITHLTEYAIPTE